MRCISLLMLLGLAGCATPKPVYLGTNFSMPSKPDSDFQCQDEPSASGVTTDEQDAQYKLGMRRAWIDCRDRLHAAGTVWRATEKSLEDSKSRAVPPEK